MRSKNALIMKMGRSYLSGGSGFHHHSMGLHDKIKIEKDEKTAPNQGNFGKIIGTKKDSMLSKLEVSAPGQNLRKYRFFRTTISPKLWEKLALRKRKNETILFLKFKSFSWRWPTSQHKWIGSHCQRRNSKDSLVVKIVPIVRNFKTFLQEFIFLIYIKNRGQSGQTGQTGQFRREIDYLSIYTNK